MARGHALPDYLVPNLRAVLVGTAAGERSAAIGHYYAGAGNEFWVLLHASGLTPELLGPERDAEILRYGLGLTDIAKFRAASRDDLLASGDYDVAGFVAKVERNRPGWVAFHGKTSAKEVARALRRAREVSLGRQEWDVGGSPVFVLPSSSASNRDPNRLEGKPSRLAWFEAFAKLLGS